MIPLSIARLVWLPLTGELLRPEHYHEVAHLHENFCQQYASFSRSADLNADREWKSTLLQGLESTGMTHEQAHRLLRSALVRAKTGTLPLSLAAAGVDSDPDVAAAQVVSSVATIVQLTKQRRSIWRLLRGLGASLPVALLALFDAQELDELLCGEPDFNVSSV